MKTFPSLRVFLVKIMCHIFYKNFFFYKHRHSVCIKEIANWFVYLTVFIWKVLNFFCLRVQQCLAFLYSNITYKCIYKFMCLKIVWTVLLKQCSYKKHLYMSLKVSNYIFSIRRATPSQGSKFQKYITSFIRNFLL